MEEAEMAAPVSSVVTFLGLLTAVCHGQSIEVANNIYDSLTPLGCTQVKLKRWTSDIPACVKKTYCPRRSLVFSAEVEARIVSGMGSFVCSYYFFSQVV